MTSPNETPSAARGTGRSGSTPESGRESPATGMTDEARRMAADAAERTKAVAADVADRVRAEAGDLAEAARQRAMDAAEDGRRMGASRLEGVAEAAHAAADALERRAPEFAPYAHKAARSIEDFSRSVRTRSVADMLHAANDFARREPAAVFGATLIAGFAVARFLSSAPRRHDEGHAGEGRGYGGFGPGRERGETMGHMREGAMGGMGTHPMGGASTSDQGMGGTQPGSGMSSGAREDRSRTFGGGEVGRDDPARTGAAGASARPTVPPMTPGGLGEGGYPRGTPGGEGGVAGMAPSTSPDSTSAVPNVGGTAGGSGSSAGSTGTRRGPGSAATDKGRE